MTISDKDLENLLTEKSDIKCNYLTPDECEYEVSFTGPCPSCERDMFMCALHVTTYLEFLDVAERNQRWVICKVCGAKSISAQLRDLIRNI